MEYLSVNPFLYISFPCSSSSMTATTTEAPPVRANESTTSKMSSLLKAQSMPHIVDTMPGYNILRLFTGGQRNYLTIRKNIVQLLLISVKMNKYIIYYLFLLCTLQIQHYYSKVEIVVPSILFKPPIFFYALRFQNGSNKKSALLCLMAPNLQNNVCLIDLLRFSNLVTRIQTVAICTYLKLLCLNNQVMIGYYDLPRRSQN